MDYDENEDFLAMNYTPGNGTSPGTMAGRTPNVFK
jgi:hypothetical protein